jgi:succinate dehydrogenase/fumarate reductase-like Fe-S protein
MKEISMSHKLEIRAFFFNAKTDYLPYYKNFSINIDADATAKDLLAKIQEENENFSFPKQKLIMKINGLVVEAKQPVSSLVERFGTSLQIDPVNSYRSNDGLKINDSDFMQSFELLAPYASEADLKHYKTLYALHYASETENYDRAYIGDAILVLAHKIITAGSEHKDEILHAITSVHSGLLDCEYENNLFKAQDHTAAIDELKGMVKPQEGPSFMEKLASRFSKKTDEIEQAPAPKKAVTVDGLETKHIAYYTGSATDNKNVINQMIKDIGASEISFARSSKLSGLSVLEDNKTLALKKAGTTILDAFDAGAEVLLVEDEAVLDMFQENFSQIQKVMGREILGLELISVKDFTAQAASIEA